MGKLNERAIEHFAMERDKVFTTAVTEDDWAGVLPFCAEYRIPMSDNERVMKGAIYKAVQECRGIPDEVKKLAAEKCEALGMEPSMFKIRRRENE